MQVPTPKDAKPVGWAKSESDKFQLYGGMARDLYVDESLSSYAISNRLDGKVSPVTIQKWIRKHGWEELRKAKIGGPQSLIAEVLKDIHALVKSEKEYREQHKGRPSKGYFDELLKGTNVLERLNGRAYFPGHCLQTVTMLLKYLELPEVRKPEIKKELAELATGFYAWATKGISA